MREIKFRAWQNITHVMLYNIEKGTGAPDENPPFADYIENKNMIVMQYTGLKDKHGRDVYEGDFVKAVLSDRNGELVEEVIEEVHFNQGLLCPFYMRVNFEEDWWKDSLQDGFEIVGNRWENPELTRAYEES